MDRALGVLMSIMPDIWTNRESELTVLNAAFARSFRSLAQYILDANPFVREEDHVLMASIRDIAQADQELAETFARIIEQLDGIPYIPTHDHSFAEFNYLSIRFLADRLIKESANELAYYEPTLPAINKCSIVNQAMSRLCDSLRSRIKVLSEVLGS
jgi:hypothetical protein